MNKIVLHLTSLLSILLILESKGYIDMFSTGGSAFNGVWEAVSGLSMFLIVVPILSVFSLFEAMMSKNAIKKALVITASKNQLHGLRIADGFSYTLTSDFSTEHHFIAKESVLEKDMFTVIKELSKDGSKFNLKPYVVIKVDLAKVSEIEEKSLINNALNAGAMNAIVLDMSANKTQINEGLTNNLVEIFG